jgi:hypothetical protein
MSKLPAGRPRQRRRILESLPVPDDVRDEFRRTSKRLSLLLELLGVCEKAREQQMQRGGK